MPKSSIGAPRAQQSDTAKAERTAAYMVNTAFADAACERLALFTCPDKPGDPMPVASAEVTFTRDQRAEAIAWTAAVLRARWIVFRAHTDGR
jgi:hypothetical protein